MSEQLTPPQAADVILYYRNGESDTAHRQKKPLGIYAVRTTLTRESILESGQPLLTLEEMNGGYQYLLDLAKPDEPHISTERQRRIDALMDGSGVPLEIALARTA